MKLEDQVCSLELSKRLKELGVKQESLWAWYNPKSRDKFRLFRNDNPSMIGISAFTVAELGEILGPNIFSSKCVSGSWLVEFPIGKSFSEKTEANARAKMLVYIIEQRIMKP